MEPSRKKRPALTVRGAIEHRGRFLFIEAADASSRAPGEPWYFLPGGHVDPGERLAEALEREVAEETGLAVETLSPLAVREFIASRHTRVSPAMPADHHVIALIFHCRLRDVSAAEARIPAVLDGASVVRGARWFAPEELAALDIRPPQLRELLAVRGRASGEFRYWPEE
jgi:ADP-ribose pyrophosphatase YjhB (NUDIX family)